MTRSLDRHLDDAQIETLAGVCFSEGGGDPGSDGRHAMRRPSSNSTTWLSRMPPLVSVIVNASPTPRTRWPAGASAKLSLPSQLGCFEGSAISSKMVDAGAATSRLAWAIVSSGTRPIQPQTLTLQY